MLTIITYNSYIESKAAVSIIEGDNFMNINLNIVSAKIVGVRKQQIICKTETNELLLINKPDKLKNDKLFTQVMFDLLRNGLWIPVNKKMKKLIQYDWLDASTENLAF